MANDSTNEQSFIEKVKRIVEANLENEKFDISTLAKEIGLSKITIYRKIKFHTNKTTSQFIREIRLNKAKDILLTEEFTVSEVTYMVGFASPSYFNKCFHDYFGISPGELRKRKDDINIANEADIIPIQKKKNVTLSRFIPPIIIIIIVLFFINERFAFFNFEPPPEKSIAVLPINYLGEPNYLYQAEGTREAILNNLAKIEDIIVLDPNSVEQYRSISKSEGIIGKELNVGYLVKVIFQKEKDKVTLTVRLIRVRDESVIWSKSYTPEWKNVFTIQNEIALRIVNEIEAKITPEEKQRIEKIPTDNLTANDFYLRGKNELWKYNFANDKEAINRAERLFLHTIEYDSTYAQAYSSLATIYWSKYYWKTFFSQNFMDSALILANRAISFDNQTAEAYFVRGNYYLEKGKRKNALHEFRKAIELAPNYHQAYFQVGKIYRFTDPIKLLENLHKAMARNKGPDLPQLLRLAGYFYSDCGFKEIAIQFQEKALELDNDTAAYYCFMGITELFFSDFAKANQFMLKSYNIDSMRVLTTGRLAVSYEFQRKFQESSKYFRKSIELSESLGESNINHKHHLANSLLQCGFHEEAEIYLDEQLKMSKRIIDEAVRDSKDYLYIIHYDMMGIYAIRGEKEKAMEHLRIFSKMEWHPLWVVNYIKVDPTFDNIRNEPEFQEFVSNIESKFTIQHNRVKEWLEKNNKNSI